MDSIAMAVMKFGALAEGVHIMRRAALEEAAKMFLEKAKAAIGTYEYGWPPLQEATIKRKLHGDTPLLETGVMRDSGTYEVVSADRATVGFEDPKLFWHEFGTRHIPPRPVVGGTIDHHGQEIADKTGVVFGSIMGEALVVGSVAAAVRNVLP